MAFQVRYLTLFLFFSIIDGFEWFLMGSLLKNIQLPEFPRAPFLVLHFSYYTLITFLMMLSVMLLSMLMILLSILSVIRHLVCGSKLNGLLNLNLIFEILWTGVRSGLRYICACMDNVIPKFRNCLSFSVSQLYLNRDNKRYLRVQCICFLFEYKLGV